MDRTKKVLITLLVIGALATVGVGTYATFNAQTTNANNSFATGTIVLKNGVGASTCYSAGVAPGTAGAPAAIGGNLGTNANSTSCGTIATASLGEPGTQATANFTLTNVGSLAGNGGLYVSVPTAPATGACATAAEASATYTGTGNLCTVLTVSMQDTTSGNCILPAAAAPCGATSVALSSLTTPVKLYNSLAAGAADTVAVTITFPNGAAGADNAYMGRNATFNLDWILNQ